MPRVIHEVDYAAMEWEDGMPDANDTYQAWEDSDFATLDLYQTAAQEYAIYPGGLVYPAMGLASEAGEVLSHVKKLARDEDMHLDIEYPDTMLSADKRAEIASEVGDCLYYLAMICTDIGYSLEEVADNNIQKLHSRWKRGKLSGSGDNR